MKQTDFLQKLQQEAAFQAKLQQQRVLPTQLDWLSSLVGRYSWQAITILSVLTALILQI